MGDMFAKFVRLESEQSYDDLDVHYPNKRKCNHLIQDVDAVGVIGNYSGETVDFPQLYE